LLLVFCAALPLLAEALPVHAQEIALVRATAATTIANNDLEGARQAAVAEARQRALREALRSILGPEEFQKQLPQLKAVLLDKPEAYLAALQIENEEIVDDGQRYQVSARADVRKNALTAALVEQRIVDPLSAAPKPSVMALIRERFETRVSGTRVTEITILKALEKRGFKIIDPEQKKLIDLRNRLFAEGTGNLQAALQSAMAFQADYLIFGEAAVGSSGPLAGTDLKARFATVTLKLVEASSGTVVSTEAGEGSRKHADELIGGNWALEDAAGAAAEKLLARFQDTLRHELMAGADILLDFYGLDFESQAKEADTTLRKAAGVKTVTRRLFYPGFTQFEVKFTGPAAELAQGLKGEEIDGQGLEVLETLPRYLRVKRLGGQARPAAGTPEMLKRYLEEKYKQFDMEKAREQDKELLTKMNELAASKKVSDEQRKQLYAAQKEIEAKRQEVYQRQQELQQRQAELKKAEAEKAEAEKRAADLEKKAAAARTAPAQARTEAQHAKQQVASAGQRAYTAQQNCSNASANTSMTVADYANCWDKGVNLANNIANVVSPGSGTFRGGAFGGLLRGLGGLGF
jgi:hypothetical protein